MQSNQLQCATEGPARHPLQQRAASPEWQSKRPPAGGICKARPVWRGNQTHPCANTAANATPECKAAATTAFGTQPAAPGQRYFKAPRTTPPDRRIAVRAQA